MIRIEELAAGYGKKTVFSRLSFSINHSGSPLVLAGKNGSGKSTLLRIIAGFQKPLSGKILNDAGTSGMAWLPQQYHISLEIPVLEFVAMGCEKPGRFLSSRPENAEEKSMAALARLGIRELATKKTHQLSGGEWQLACLAQMLVQEAGTWLLDEPTSSLDIGYKKKVFQLLWEEAAAGKTIILSTHDIPFLPHNGGSFLLVNTTSELFGNTPEERGRLLRKLEEE